jgi:hypothetical protein
MPFIEPFQYCYIAQSSFSAQALISAFFAGLFGGKGRIPCPLVQCG